MAKAKETFLQLLRQFNEQGRDLSAAPCATYAPKVFAGHPKSNGIGKRRFEAAMQELFGSNQIKVEETGPPSRRRSRLILAGLG